MAFHAGPRFAFANFLYLCPTMQTLSKIIVQDFRNIEFQELAFSEGINCICGDNGEGKTNLIDAVYYLSMTKSAFVSSDRYNFRYGTEAFAISGTYRTEAGGVMRIGVEVSAQGGKKIRRDDKPYTRAAGHIGLIPVVIVSPADVSMISESGEERRRFANAVISQMDGEYLAALQQYNRLLSQRNRLLKDGGSDPVLLDAFDGRMGECSRVIYDRRARFTEELGPVVAERYAELSGGGEAVSISYRSELSSQPLEELLKASRQRDLLLGYTTCGVQRDDFVFSMDGHPIRRNGSQGQQKSFLVSLKFAQYSIMKASYGFAPLMLLDDVFDKLDMNRVHNLLSMVAGSDFGQIFITDSDKGRMERVLEGVGSDRAYFEAKGGAFTKL